MCALIKKRQSWPIGVPGDVMQRRFDRPEVKVGDVDATGTQDNVPYFIWGMKEPDYVMRMMATGGPLPLGSTKLFQIYPNDAADFWLVVASFHPAEAIKSKAPSLSLF
jgi:hypothetical protein